MDGHMRAYDARDGSIIWDFDTGQTFAAVNGISAHGGAIDYGGEVIAHGMLFVNSASMRQAGNLLLAFAGEATHSIEDPRQSRHNRPAVAKLWLTQTD